MYYTGSPPACQQKNSPDMPGQISPHHRVFCVLSLKPPHLFAKGFPRPQNRQPFEILHFYYSLGFGIDWKGRFWYTLLRIAAGCSGGCLNPRRFQGQSSGFYNARNHPASDPLSPNIARKELPRPALCRRIPQRIPGLRRRESFYHNMRIRKTPSGRIIRQVGFPPSADPASKTIHLRRFPHEYFG